jgi:periplasmic glucans biosynthesis protein
MYWFSETKRPIGLDWRPDVHDSDGLAVWTGSGEHLWRPLNNPREVMVSSFVDTNPHGFGLLQRDRNFDHYLDGVHYERRPSLWVEPLDGWGKGSVQLVELPTDSEAVDNIVAMWVPADPAKTGATYRLRYRLHWLADEPFPTQLARCVATRIGRGGQPGHSAPDGARKFVVDFSGPSLADLPVGVKPDPVLSVSRGNIANAFTESFPDGVPGHWRAQFDLVVSGNDPVEMRLFLRTGDKVLSETWLYQYVPARPASRELATGT